MIRIGDCLEVMATLDANSVDAIVTDPPYGIGFMGKAWDGQAIVDRFTKRDATEQARRRNGVASAAGSYDLSPKAMRAFQDFSAEWARGALRVLKPGGHCVAFASPRTFHRLVCGLEEAGFEIRDTLMWVFGSGFPKSKNLDGDRQGWGTALKPAWEPIILARKPVAERNIAANVATYGTGAINIDGCRIEAAEQRAPNTGRGGIPCRHDDASSRLPGPVSQPHDLGRWPANLLHDGSDEVLAGFPSAPGAQADVRGDEPSAPGRNTYGEYAGRRGLKARRDGEASADRRYTERGSTDFAPLPGMRRATASSAARFFYCAKADRTDRNDGLDGLTTKDGRAAPANSPYLRGETERQNHHPTVKPTDLMRWLCRLVTPPGGLVLDPFAGSGSTGRGAIAEGFQFVGIELDPEYAAIAEARIRAMQPGLPLWGAA